MSSNGPKLLSPQRTPLSPKSFSLRAHVSSPLRFKMLTTLPDEKNLNVLRTVNPKLCQKVLSALGSLYSHVVQRQAHENVTTFFHHVASAALFERDCQQLIKGKDHGKKAGVIFNQVKNVLVAIDKSLSAGQQSLTPQQKQVLLRYKALFTMQHNVLVETLKKLKTEVKSALAKSDNLQIDKLDLLPISQEDRTLVTSMYPETPPSAKGHPVSDRLTPKAMSQADKSSVSAIQQLHRDLDRSSQVTTSRNLLLAFNQSRSQGTAVPVGSSLPSSPKRKFV